MDADAALRRHRKPILDFVAGDLGALFAVSEDPGFLALFRETALRRLLLPRERVCEARDGADFFRQAREPFFRDKKLLLLVDRGADSRAAGEFIRSARALLETCRVLLITGRLDRETLSLLHEEGVDQFLAKPVEEAALLEKLALAARPEGKLGQALDQGRALLARGRFEEALRLADKALEFKPDSAAAQVLRGDALRRLGRPDAARAAYEAAAAAAPAFLEPLSRLAELCAAQGDAPRRLEVLARLDALSPANVRRKVELGGLLLAAGRRDQAKQAFADAVRRATAEAMGLIEAVRLSIADACLEQDPALAEEYYRAVVAARREGFRRADAGLFNRLGLALRRQGRHSEAVAEYRKALRVDPGDEHLHFNLALALSEAGRSAEALEALSQVLAAQPDFGEGSDALSYQMGAVYAAAGRPAEARSCLARCLALSPGHDKAGFLLSALEGRS